MALVLTRKDVEELLTMKEAMSAVEEAFRQYALGKVIMPLRTTIRIADYKGVNLAMPAYVGGEMDALGLKVVSVYGDNPEKYGLPTVLATVLLNDPKTGDLLAIMDGSWLTAMRTGAVSGVATQYLAREDARTAAVFGAGVQARTQLMAVCEARGVTLARVYDPVHDVRDRYCQEMGEKLGIEVVPAASPRAAVEGADVIVAASSAKSPLFDGTWLSPGTHVNGVGSHAPAARELDTATMVNSKLVVDQREAALAEAGDVIMPIDEGHMTAADIHAELGEVVAGLKEARVDRDEITVFKSVGLAIQDVATATRVYQLAKEKGAGTTLSLA